MQQALELFRIAAEELNFSRAAQKGFVTQQCLSDHIKRLENNYGVPLFHRKPRIALTEYGQALYRTVLNMKVIETNFKKEIQEIAHEERGRIIFGINATRARTLLPCVYSRFYEKYPLIHLDIQMNETRRMEELILTGKMDLFLGVDAMFHPELTARPICKNPLFCVLSAHTFRSVFGRDSAGFSRISLKDLRQLPFLLCLPESTTRQLVESSLGLQNIYLKNTLAISDYEIHFDICAKQAMASICPLAAIIPAMDKNRLLPPERRLLFFPTEEISQQLNIHLIHHKDLHFTGYLDHFISLITEEIERQNRLALEYASRSTSISE